MDLEWSDMESPEGAPYWTAESIGSLYRVVSGPTFEAQCAIDDDSWPMWRVLGRFESADLAIACCQDHENERAE